MKTMRLAWLGIWLLSGSCLLAQAENWTRVSVPGAWEAQADRELEDYDGFAWYRCYVKVPERWTDLEGRPLWYESVTLNVPQVADAHEVYINGKRIGGAGKFPPKFAAAEGGVHRYKVPPGSLKAGHYNTIALRVYNQSGPGGFVGDAPILAGYFLEAVLKGPWEFRTGDHQAWASGAREKRPTDAAFDKFTESSSALDRPTVWNPGKRTAPQDALAAMEVADDLVVEQMLAEPEIAQPLSLWFDARGRMWVVQYRQYPYPAGVKMVSRNKYYRAVYDKVPPPPPNHARGLDRITIHEDTDGDGQFDHHKTFLAGLNLATSVLGGREGVWVLHPPYLLFYPDKDHDDVPDGDPVVHLRGFGLSDTHSAPNSLRWGPDGWIYGMQGSNLASHVRVGPAPENEGESETPGNDAAYCEGPALWRYHPDQAKFEFVAEGGGNAFGLEVDAQGRFYSGYNGGNTRGYYYLQGGYYEKGRDVKYGAHTNPYVFGMLPYMQHGPVPRFTHTFVKYEEGVLPTKYQNKLFCVDPLHRHVVLADIKPQGSSFQTKDIGIPLASLDITFRPVDIQAGPDGAVYVVDFCEEFIAHGQHYQGMLDNESGRIYRLRPKAGSLAPKFSLRETSSAELLALLRHPSKWYRQKALRLIAERQDASLVEPLRDGLDEPGQVALESLWALNLLGEFDSELALRGLRHRNPHVRRWTVRLLGDSGEVAPEIGKRLIELASTEPDPEVRVQLAASARRLPADPCLPIVRELTRHEEDVDDPFIPLMLWWALESKAGSHPEQVLRLFVSPKFWQRPLAAEALVGRLMRRYASSGVRSELPYCARLLRLAPDKASQERLLAGFEQAFRGRSLAQLPVEVAEALVSVGGGSLSLQVRLGKAAAKEEALQVLTDEKAPLPQRLELVQVFGEVQEPRSLPVLLKLIAPEQEADLQSAALTALQNYEEAKIAEQVLEIYPKLTADVQAVAQTLFVSRKAWTRRFLEAIDAGRINPQSVPAETVRLMTIHNDPAIARLTAKHFESVRGATNAQMQEQITQLAKVVKSKPGDVYQGKELFTNSCAKCHLMFGEGGRIGPDLTQYQRDDVVRMLLHIVNPSAEIREGYESYTIITVDGRVLSGFLFDQDKQVIVIRGVDGQNITVPREDIDEMLKQSRSLMPERLLDQMTEQQIRDLFAFLRSTQPIFR